MKRSRGNATSKAVRAERQSQEIVLMNEGKTQAQITTELRISRATLWRDLQTLSQQLNAGNLAEFEQRRNAHESELQRMLEYLLQSEDLTDSELGKLFREYKSDIAKLRGLNAESRSVIAHVSTANDPLFLKFKSACADLTEAQIETVLNFATALVREPRVTVRDASWYPPVETPLLEGETENETA